jgi:hypothetical protein
VVALTRQRKSRNREQDAPERGEPPPDRRVVDGQDSVSSYPRTNDRAHGVGARVDPYVRLGSVLRLAGGVQLPRERSARDE